MGRMPMQLIPANFSVTIFFFFIFSSDKVYAKYKYSPLSGPI